GLHGLPRHGGATARRLAERHREHPDRRPARTLTNLDNGDRAAEYLENPDMSKIYEEETKKPEPKQIHMNARSSSPRRR
ncbi:MAG: hypothetical protein AAGF10_07115, partial [Verrucomicrobiota bacterium]